MIKCTKENAQEIFDYIGKDYGKCAYLYIDLKKYGFENENVNIWYQKEGDQIKVLMFQYYNGMHVFSRDNIFDAQDAANAATAIMRMFMFLLFIEMPIVPFVRR